MLEFICWYIIGTIVLVVLDGIFMSCITSSLTDEETRDVMDKDEEYMIECRYRIESFVKSRVLTVIFKILIYPVIEIGSVINAIKATEAIMESKDQH